MTGFPRYAIYYAPTPGSALDRFGAEHLGYDVSSGDDVPFPPDLVETVPDWQHLTQDARKYGFHATLKAPFALAAGRDEAGLMIACEAFAGKVRPIPVIVPVVRSISGFIAVIPEAPLPALTQLAADCVVDFDVFRAPLTAEDRARRNPAALTAVQVEQLDRWGYPYVMDDFRFHMTLTERIPAERREGLIGVLRERFARLGLRELAIDRIAVFRQDDATARFRMLRQFELRGIY